MITRDILEKLKLTPKELKRKFAPNAMTPKVTELVELLRSRIDEGRDQNLRDFRMWWAMDVAYDVPFKQMTYSMLTSFIDSIGRNDTSSKEVLKSAKEWGLSQFITESTDCNGKACSKVDLPVFFNIFIPLVRAYLNIRWAKLFNDRNVFPLLKYDPVKFTTRDRTKCEILTDAVEMQGQQLGYRPTLKQWLFNALHYGTSIMFPVEDWYKEYGPEWIAAKKKVGKKIKKQGLRYNIPHPSRVFYDQMYRIGTINSDSGCRFAGYWRVVPYRDVMENKRFWNTDQITMMGHDLIRSNSVFFTTVYPCQMEFPVCSETSAMSGAGELDRESQSSFYTSVDADKAVVLTDLFCKLVPKEWGLGDVDYPLWFRFVLANDDDVIYAAPLCYTPPLYIGYDAHEERRRNASLTLEIAPFQDHLSNMMSQMILTAKQNLTRVSFVNTDLVPKQYLDQLQNLGEDLYRTTTFIPFSARKTVMAQSDIKQAFTNVSFPALSTVELMQGFRLLLDTLERVLVFSAQEVGAVAAHEQTAEETRIIAGSVNNRVALTDSFVDDGIAAWKKQLYEALMAYGDKTVWAQVPTIPPVTAEILKEIGFTVDEPGVPGQTNAQVHGPLTALEMDGFVSGREGENRINNPEVAAGMAQIMNIMLSNQMTALAIGPQQAIDVFNTISRIAGLPRDFKLHVANPELINKMLNGEQQGEDQNKQMAEMFKQLAEEILNKSGEQAQKITEQALTPIVQEHKQLVQAVTQNSKDISGFQQLVESILSRLKVLGSAASANEAGVSPAA